MIDRSKHATVEFALHWRSAEAQHCERRCLDNVNFWRDYFPVDLAESLDKLAVGEQDQVEVQAADLSLDYDSKLVQRVARQQFQPERLNHSGIEPRVGRFYPRNFIVGGGEYFVEDRLPCRIVGLTETELTLDLNHPLARLQQASISARLVALLPSKVEHGGRCNDIPQELTRNGPGMQISYPGVTTDFLSDVALHRQDSRDDSVFYAAPRLVNHLDSLALSHLSALYGRFMRPGMRILDLMSSWISHLPPQPVPAQVIGLGMNAQELAQNPQLTDTVVQDLNQHTPLPFAAGSFDLVVCTVSIEYLIQPLAVIAEVRRVLAPGGHVVISFSDRWFPTKAIALWSELHPFERLGLVLEYLRRVGGFTGLATETVQGWPRPEADPYSQQLLNSDPLYVVYGQRNDAAASG